MHRFTLFIIFFILLSSLWLSCDLSGKMNHLDPEIDNPTDNLKISYDVAFSPSPDHQWTLMIYLDAANNLEIEGIYDMKELEYGLHLLLRKDPGIGSYFNIIVLFDRIPGYYTSTHDDWSDTRLYKVVPSPIKKWELLSTELYDPDNIFGFSTGITDSVEKNMADPATLRAFINYSVANYPADHYGLILWDHGNGPAFVSSNIELSIEKSMAIAVDEELPYYDVMSIEELRQAIEGSLIFGPERKLDLLGFDACLMGSTEIAYEFRTLVDVMVASMAKEWLQGWNYDGLLNSIIPGQGTGTARVLGKLMVQSYKDSAEGHSSTQTLAAIDLSRMEALKSAVDELAVQIYRADRQRQIETLRDASYHFFAPHSEYQRVNWPYFDLNDLVYKIFSHDGYLPPPLVKSAGNLLEVMGTAVISAYGGESYGGYYGTGDIVKRGLFIVFPMGDRYISGSNPISYYSAMEWYTNVSLVSPLMGDSIHGGLEFCTFNDNSVVETWIELLEAWYDPDNKLITWNTF